jgi:hypothetical protein
MLKIVVVGKSYFRLLLWELLQLQGTVDDVAFVDNNPARLDCWTLGIRIHPIDWLITAHRQWQHVVIDAAFADLQPRLENAGWQADELSVAPTGADRRRLAAWVRDQFPDPFGELLPRRISLRPRHVLGVFGTGVGGRKVWEAAMTYDRYIAAWFADNDPRRQGGTFFGLEVIKPGTIPARDFTAIAVASMHRASIVEQLLTLGVTRQQIITPDVTAPLAQVNSQIFNTLSDRFA